MLYKSSQPVHRLDYPTSGLLLIGKTSRATIALNQLFENRQMYKTYHAVSIGKMESEGVIQQPVDNREAHSRFQVLKSEPSERFEFLNLVRLFPSTGRKHQLRIHLATLGNPILGDKDYGKEGLILRGKGLYLHASSLKFIHPITNQPIEISEPLPKKFTRIFPSA